jgi:hypothetical protein
MIASIDAANLMPGELSERRFVEIGKLVRNEHIIVLLGNGERKKTHPDYNSTRPILPLPEFG